MPLNSIYIDNKTNVKWHQNLFWESYVDFVFKCNKVILLFWKKNNNTLDWKAIYFFIQGLN
jgi:hypothetical protein